MEGIIYTREIEYIECCECGYNLLVTSEDVVHCANVDCKEYGIHYRVPDEVIIKLEEV